MVEGTTLGILSYVDDIIASLVVYLEAVKWHCTKILNMAIIIVWFEDQWQQNKVPT